MVVHFCFRRAVGRRDVCSSGSSGASHTVEPPVLLARSSVLGRARRGDGTSYKERSDLTSEIE